MFLKFTFLIHFNFIRLNVFFQIYALNKVMTELEYKRFLDFCQAKGLNKV